MNFDALKEFAGGLEHFAGSTCYEFEGDPADVDDCMKCRLLQIIEEMEVSVNV